MKLWEQSEGGCSASDDRSELLRRARAEAVQTYGPEGGEMFDAFIKYGGLYCHQRWREHFSFFHSAPSMVDILLKYKLV